MKLKMFYAGLVLVAGSYCMNAQTETIKNDGNKPEEKVITHEVQMGETVLLLARKYKTTPQEIYALNPNAVDGISSSTVLQIPVGKVAKIDHRKNGFAFSPVKKAEHDKEAVDN